MLRGYRLLIFAACVGLASVTFALGIIITSLDTQDERYQSYRYASDKPLEVDATGPTQANSQAFEDRTPCKKPKGQGESDLCAQWRAANAAEDSAFWTKLGFWIATIGSTLLLWQIILTRKAVKDTSEATEAMRKANSLSEAAIEQARAASLLADRPWIAYETFTVIHAQNAYLGHPPRREAEVFAIKLMFKNTGTTPAISVRLSTQSKMVTKGEPFPTFQSQIHLADDLLVFPSMKIESCRDVVLIGGELRSFKENSACACVYTEIEYFDPRDPNKEPHRTAISVLIFPNGERVDPSGAAIPDYAGQIGPQYEMT